MGRYAIALLLCLLTVRCASVPMSPAQTMSAQLAVYRDADLPLQYPEIRGESHARYLLAFVAAAERLHVSVVLSRRFPHRIAGFYDFETRTAYVDLSLSGNAVVATLLHELGHALEPVSMRSSEDGQAFAEAVSYLACKRIGLDVWQSSMIYLRPPSVRARIQIEDVIMRHALEIDAAVDALLAGVQPPV